MIGCFRLPTHSRNAHRKNFDDPFLTLYGPNSFFVVFGDITYDSFFFVYRLISAKLLKNFFDDPFLIKIKLKFL